MNYTSQAREVLKLADEAAALMEHPYIGTEHLLIGLSKIYAGVAGQVLDMNGVREEETYLAASVIKLPLFLHILTQKGINIIDFLIN